MIKRDFTVYIYNIVTSCKCPVIWVIKLGDYVYCMSLYQLYLLIIVVGFLQSISCCQVRKEKRDGYSTLIKLLVIDCWDDFYNKVHRSARSVRWRPFILPPAGLSSWSHFKRWVESWKINMVMDFVYCKKCKTMNSHDHEDCTQMLLVINIVSVWTDTYLNIYL